MFYPSTVAIDEGVSTTAEYAMAKMAGEILAKYLNEFMTNIHIVSPPPAPHPDRSDRNRRGRQRRQRVGRDASHCI